MKRTLVLSLVAVVGLGCDDAGTTRIASQGVDCTLQGMTVSPPTVNVFVGDSTRFSVKASTCGTALGSTTVHWQSSNAAVASVDSLSGLARGLTPGPATIIATLVSDPAVKGAAVVVVNAR